MSMCFALHACETIVLPGIAALRHYDYIARQEAWDDAAKNGDRSLTWPRKAALVASPSEGVAMSPRAIISAARSADTHLRVQQQCNEHMTAMSACPSIARCWRSRHILQAVPGHALLLGPTSLLRPTRTRKA